MTLTTIKQFVEETLGEPTGEFFHGSTAAHKIWTLNKVKHRIFGPAVKGPVMDEWWFLGKRYNTEEEHNHAIKNWYIKHNLGIIKEKIDAKSDRRETDMRDFTD
jgi:hypothetical protein